MKKFSRIAAAGVLILGFGAGTGCVGERASLQTQGRAGFRYAVQPDKETTVALVTRERPVKVSEPKKVERESVIRSHGRTGIRYETVE